MMKTSKKIIFFGNERLATGVVTTAPTLRKLIHAGYDIAAVITNNEPAISRKSRELEVQKIAYQNDIPVIYPKKMLDIQQLLLESGAEAGILAAFGKIIPQWAIDIFPAGIINLHPSLLPLHRGPTPLESVILNGSTETGVSIMQLSRAMDAGNIYAQKTVQLTGDETKQELAYRLNEIGSSMILECLPSILKGDLATTPQDETRATYDKLLTKDDGLIRWTLPAGDIERQIRAFAVWPQSKTTIGAIESTITQVSVVNIQGRPGEHTIYNKKPAIYCAENALVIEKIKPAGKQEMTGEGFLAGYRSQFLIN